MNRLLASLILIFSASWLLTLRFEPTHLTGLLIEQRSLFEPTNTETPAELIIPGQVMSTDKESWRHYSFKQAHEPVEIFLSENSSLKLLSSLPNEKPIFEVISGRIVIYGSSILKIRDTEIMTSGLTALTFYSWLDELEIANPNQQNLLIYQKQQKLDLPSNSVRLNTFDSKSTPQTFIFNPESSVAKDFYAWVQDKTQD